MKIEYQLYGRCLWHVDCETGRTEPMKIIRDEEARTLLECARCGKRGYYPKGGVGCVTVEEA